MHSIDWQRVFASWPAEIVVEHFDVDGMRPFYHVDTRDDALVVRTPHARIVIAGWLFDECHVTKHSKAIAENLLRTRPGETYVGLQIEALP